MSILTFNGVNFQPLKQQNQIWLSSSELSKALGYAESDSVTKLYNRHLDEFSPNMTQVIDVSETVNLTAPNNNQNLVKKVRIFNLRGCHLIAMFAKTKIAKEFRKWVLDILDKEVGKPTQVRHTISTEQQAQIQKCVRQKCQSNSTHYQTVYTALKDKFGVPSYKDILAADFENAMAFIAGFALPHLDHNDQNAFWRMVGLLEYDRISREIRQLNNTINQAEHLIGQARRQINHLSKTTGLLYDAFGEQRLPTKAPVLNEAQEFIARQMDFKRQIGLIA